MVIDVNEIHAGANPEGLLVFPEVPHFPHNNVFFLFTIAY